MRALRGRLALLSLVALASCTRPRTQLVVAIDSDLTWGPTGALRAVQITVRSNDPEGQLRDRRVVELNDAVPLPASFGVVPLDGDPSRRVWIEARGCGESGCDTPLVSRQAYVGFVEGQTLLLQMTLAGVCRRVECAIATETCLPSTGACGNARVEATTLPAWTGRFPHADTGVDAMDAPVADAADVEADVSPMSDDAGDVASSDAADAVDVVSDDRIMVGPGDVAVDVGCAATCGGRCVDLQSDTNHCGSCGRACTTSRANSVGACVSGDCVVRCAAGYGDCDGNPANGCELDLRTSVAHCGSCGSACAANANATAVCVEGACGFTCSAGFADCDGNATNGCEVTLATDAAHCGACGRVCSVANATAACAGGVCAVGACASGFGDCDRMAANGCERGLTTDAANCGACGRTCGPANATGACVAGSCRVGACAAGFGDCDGNAANGCESDLRRDESHCGSCTHACRIGDYCSSSSCRPPMLGSLFEFGCSSDGGEFVSTGALVSLGIDTSGNIYALARISSGSRCGGSNVVSSALLSFTDRGVLRWQRVIPGTLMLNRREVLGVSPSGSVGVLTTGMDLDFGNGRVFGIGTYLAIFDANGSLTSSRVICSDTSSDAALAFDELNHLYLFVSGSCDFGSGSTSGLHFSSIALPDVVRWSRRLGGRQAAGINGVTGRPRTLGGGVCSSIAWSNTTVDLGAGPVMGSANPLRSAAIWCVNSDGSTAWRSVTDSDSVIPGDVSINRQGLLAVTGMWQTTSGSGSLFGCSNVSRSPNQFVSLLAPTGTCVWARNVGTVRSSNDDLVTALDDHGNTYTATYRSSYLKNIVSLSLLGATRWERESVASDARIQAIFASSADSLVVGGTSSRFTTSVGQTFNEGLFVVSWYQ